MPLIRMKCHKSALGWILLGGGFGVFDWKMLSVRILVGIQELCTEVQLVVLAEGKGELNYFIGSY